MQKHQLIMIHGMGEGDFDDDYSKLEGLLTDKLKPFDAFNIVKVRWQIVTRAAEETIFDTCFPHYIPAPESLKLSYVPFHPIKSARYFMTFYIGDVIAYTAEPDNKNGIRKEVWNRIRNDCSAHPYSLICHSLGSVLAFDYLFKLFVRNPPVPLFIEEQSEPDIEELNQCMKNFRNLFTFGSPIGLFLMRQANLWGGTTPAFSILENPVRAGHVWLNFHDKQDPFAYPLETLFSMSSKDKTAASRIKDIPVDTGDFVVDSHTKYWENDEMAEKIAEVLNANP